MATTRRGSVLTPRRIKRAGAKNVRLQLFIPEDYLKREAEHVEGFSAEPAVVTHVVGRSY